MTRWLVALIAVPGLVVAGLIRYATAQLHGADNDYRLPWNGLVVAVIVALTCTPMAMLLLGIPHPLWVSIACEAGALVLGLTYTGDQLTVARGFHEMHRRQEEDGR